MSVINSFTQHTINLTRKALRLGSDFVHPVHDDTPDEPDYLSNADVPVETNIALPHSDDWDDGHLTVTDIDPATGLLTTSTEGNPPLDEGTSTTCMRTAPNVWAMSRCTPTSPATIG